MAKILVVDDEVNIRRMIRKFAEFEGYEVFEAVDGMDAVEKCEGMSYDCIIMDIMMPNLDGFSAVKKIHEFCDTPVIMLSARGEEYDRIHGFEVGVDDYVVKPFSCRELMMRVAAILKRYQGGGRAKRKLYEYKDLKVDLSARKVFIHGKEVEMSPKEYTLLFYMIENEGIALTREQLIRDVWGCGL